MDGERDRTMGRIKPFEKVKLVTGIMYTKDEYYEEALSKLITLYGDVDSETDEYYFSSYSVFYDSEMNGTVKKRFLSFKTLIDPGWLSGIKRETNKIEDEFSTNGMRNVNIDPCILTHGAFIMATTKGASFRIPLSDGIYGDLSLVYANKMWSDFYWTYSDVKSVDIKGYLALVRHMYLVERKDWLIKGDE